MTTATLTEPQAAAPASATHPLAGTTMTGAEMIIQVLADQGVDAVFGYSGGAILPTYDAIFRYNAAHEQDAEKQIRLIVPANEQGAGFMAAGYSRATGRCGVMVVTSGPGATNCVTPVRDCLSDSIPLVMISGQVPRAAIGTDAFQEAPVFQIMASAAKHVFLVTKPEELEATVRAAFEIALSGRPGPVVIDVPKDVQNWSGTFQGAGSLPLRGYRQYVEELRDTHLPAEKARTFFQMLAASERPLIYAGGGVVNANAAEDLRAFARRFNIPVVTTLLGISSMDTTDPLTLEMLGMHGTPYANYAVEDCDLLLAVGARFDDRVAGKVKEFAPNARFLAHIDIDASELGKVKAINWAHAADAGRALQDLLTAGKDFTKDFAPWHAHLDALRKAHPMNYNRESELLQPQEVIELLSNLTGGEAIVTTGVGQHQMWAAQYFDFKHPRSWITSGSMGTMGFGLPAAIGAQVACPGKLVIDIDGDGSIRMNLGELETAPTYGLPVKVLLLNNLGDGMVRQWQKTYFGERFSGTDKSLHRKDFIKAAEADGYSFALRVSERAKLKDALKAFIAHPEAAFLEVMIDPDACVFPMVGPGSGYKEMMTGPYISKREAPLPANLGGLPMPDLF